MRRHALFLVILALLTPGCAYVTRDISINEEPSLASLHKANVNPNSVKRLFQTPRVMLDSLPVGAIVAMYPYENLALPENWKYCNGSEVTDRESPLYGQRLPDLTDNRFLMGTANAFGATGGANEIEPAGEHIHPVREQFVSHSHGGLTGIEENNGTIREMHEKGEINVRITEQGHKHVIESSGDHRHDVAVLRSDEHDHGGDARPRFLGVLYIIKIK